MDEYRKGNKGETPEMKTETVFPCLGIFSLVPGSPAQKAGLLVGDSVVAIDGGPIQATREDFLAYTRMEPEKERRLTILRNGNFQELQLIPEFHEEAGVYLMGLYLEPAEYAIKSFEGREVYVARKKGIILSGGGQALCEYVLEYGNVEPYVSLNKRKTKREGLRIDSFVLKYDRGGELCSYDLFQEFPIGDTKLIISSEPVEEAAGFHSGLYGQIVINWPEDPGSIEVFLHESVHVWQKNDPILIALHAMYNADHKETYDRQNADGVRYPHLSRKIVEHVSYIMKALPDIFSDTAYGEFLNELQDKADELITRVNQYEQAIRSAHRIASTFFFEKEKQQIEATATDCDSLMRGVLQGETEDADFEEQVKVYVALLKSAGVVFTDLNHEQLMEATEKDQECIVDLHENLINPDSGTEIQLDRYDEETQCGVFRFSFLWGPNSETRTVEWHLPVDRKDFLLEKERYDVYRKQKEEELQTIKLLQEKFMATKPATDISVDEILQLPRWITERDAEIGALLGLKKIKRDTGLDFFAAYENNSGNPFARFEESRIAEDTNVGKRVAWHMHHIGMTGEMQHRINFSERIKQRKSFFPEKE